MTRPRLYIDVDGVLFGLYAGHFQLRPDVVGFLDRCTRHFDCRWLTAWPHERLQQLLQCIYGSNLRTAIRYTNWLDRKVSAIDLAGDFYWLEDGIAAGDLELLQVHGAVHRYIEVNPYGRDVLDGVWVTLVARAGIAMDRGGGDP